MFRTVGPLLPLVLGGLLASSSALAADAKTICVFDPLGTNGTAFKFAQEMRLEAKAASGIDIELKASPASVDEFGVTPLHFAAGGGSLDTVRRPEPE